MHVSQHSGGSYHHPTQGAYPYTILAGGTWKQYTEPKKHDHPKLGNGHQLHAATTTLEVSTTFPSSLVPVISNQGNELQRHHSLEGHTLVPDQDVN